MAAAPDPGLSGLEALASYGSEESRKRRKVDYKEGMSDAAFERLLRSDNSRRQRQKVNGPRIRVQLTIDTDYYTIA